MRGSLEQCLAHWGYYYVRYYLLKELKVWCQRITHTNTHTHAIHTVIHLFSTLLIPSILSQDSCVALGWRWRYKEKQDVASFPWSCGHMTAERDPVMTKPSFQNMLLLLYFMLRITMWESRWVEEEFTSYGESAKPSAAHQPGRRRGARRSVE